MDLYEFIIKVTEVVVWPVTVLVIVLIFKKHISAIATRVSSLRYKDLEIKVRKDLEKAESEAEALQLPPPDGLKPINEKDVRLSPYDGILKIAEVSPRAAVIEAWRIVEQSTIDAAKANGIEIDPRSPVSRVADKLIRAGILKPNAKGFYQELNSIRNLAAHSRDFGILTREAERYIDLALSLAYELQTLSGGVR